MSIKEKVFIKFYGYNGLEAYYLDSYLSTFSDGLPKENIPCITEEFGLAYTQARIEDKLVKDGFLRTLECSGIGYAITSEGQLHLANGGYKGQLIEKKLSRLSLWIGIFAFIISVWAFVRTF